MKVKNARETKKKEREKRKETKVNIMVKLVKFKVVKENTLPHRRIYKHDLVKHNYNDRI